MTFHVNSQGEKISIAATELDGEPVEVLVIHDDPPPRGTGTTAPMLLDEGTRAWLKETLG